MINIIVPVIGMHRSGTSALAGVLHKGGVVMGGERTFIPVPSPENPKGFFEDIRFRRLNDSLLEKKGYTVKSWDLEVPELTDSYLLRAQRRRLIKKCDAGMNPWGWKDPRTCLTLDFWISDLIALGVIERTRVVFLHRHPLAVARSLQERNGMEQQHGLRLWIEYNKRALASIERFGLFPLSLSYEKLIAFPGEQLRRLSSFLDGMFDAEEGGTFLDAGLKRSGPERIELQKLKGDKAGDEALDLYKRLATS